ncbi:MAG: L-2-amino-thiazoline-4-carboxylic acid hydrolase [Alphaproteobacteria bacterium]|nr:L-2-amino-thiazoline-4-carboxylic acid hydrolase [Alphaproteobacteria bacterium]MBU0797735.1 L-2-amino-thiazoline-4-carboxylic acid hydrolase [Alphaproteobacteria bacterium]MBU0887104.1 L-2-amino-thiazoline-4-carboxylic acid hydrolase [Alphaproteobacteria bacterium]MBU1814354.1 L-2-amino-thiazoline-4-carboxylic acid hydrolase [Alphaproteobacteria bacterium]MBU2090663.1 L-2-amino-thiazoline-4-carboxylic acid hydrolase [Alphaproteobacteria bacterium]
MSNTLPIIQRRRIEAEILKQVYDVAKDSVGRETAQTIIGEAVRRSSIAQAESFAALEPEGTSMASFIRLYDLWKADDALQVDVKRQDDVHFDFNVTRCRYAEMYKDMGLGEIGHLLSCQRDGTFCEGYDANIQFERSQTIMQGASHCDFRYTYKKAEKA